MNDLNQEDRKKKGEKKEKARVHTPCRTRNTYLVNKNDRTSHRYTIGAARAQAQSRQQQTHMKYTKKKEEGNRVSQVFVLCAQSGRFHIAKGGGNIAAPENTAVAVAAAAAAAPRAMRRTKCPSNIVVEPRRKLVKNTHTTKTTTTTTTERRKITSMKRKGNADTPPPTPPTPPTTTTYFRFICSKYTD